MNLLKEIWTTFWTAFKNGGNTHTSVNDFLNSPDHGPQWTEQQIVNWISSLSHQEQDEIKKLTIAARAKGINPHEFLCKLREEQEESKRNTSREMAAGVIDAWPQFQAEWLLTSAFIKDTFGGGLFKK